MNKKGFSLVELLAVIAIMGILSGICILAVTRYISNSKKKTYKNFEENLRGAAVNYLSSHTELSTVSGGVTLTYSTLVEGQYVEFELVRTDKGLQEIYEGRYGHSVGRRGTHR